MMSQMTKKQIHFAAYSASKVKLFLQTTFIISFLSQFVYVQVRLEFIK